VERDLKNHSIDDGAELEQLLADVARILSTARPDEALVFDALERVDDMISRAQRELAAVARELLAELQARAAAPVACRRGARCA